VLQAASRKARAGKRVPSAAAAVWVVQWAASSKALVVMMSDGTLQVGAGGGGAGRRGAMSSSSPSPLPAPHQMPTHTAHTYNLQRYVPPTPPSPAALPTTTTLCPPHTRTHAQGLFTDASELAARPTADDMVLFQSKAGVRSVHSLRALGSAGPGHSVAKRLQYMRALLRRTHRQGGAGGPGRA
jgi:hypothetical protein